MLVPAGGGASVRRAAGKSKLHRRIVLEALLRVTDWALTGGRRRVRAHHELSVAVAGLDTQADLTAIRRW
jgi:hypothetical protein